MGSRVKEDQLRVSVLLKDTVNLLCKNGLAFKNNMKIVGVLGITLDDEDVFVVHINEAMQNPDAIPDESDSPTKSTGHRTPTKRRRRRSSDSVNTPHSKSARRAAVHIKTDPDDIVVEEIKIHDTDSDEGGQSGDDGLNYAISSIRSLDAPGGTEAAGQYTATSTSQPFITGLVPNKSNIADTGQISDNSSFAWDSNAAQGHAGVSGWSGQGADQTMSQMTQQTMSQGAVQGSSQEGMLQPGSSLGSPGSARIGTVAVVARLPQGLRKPSVGRPKNQETKSRPSSNNRGKSQWTFRDKIAILREAETGEHGVTAAKYGIPESTMRSWQKQGGLSKRGKDRHARQHSGPARGKYRAKWTLSQKIDIVEETELNGLVSTASKYNIPESTIRTWKKEDLASKLQAGTLKVIGRPPAYGKDLDDAVVQLLTEQRESGLVLTRPLVASTARELISPAHPGFKASYRWVSNFVSRHNLSLDNTTETGAAASGEASD